MSDLNTHLTGSHGQRVVITEDHAVHGWCQAFGVTEEQLRVAVAAVGDDAEEVRSHLGQGG